MKVVKRIANIELYWFDYQKHWDDERITNLLRTIWKQIEIYLYVELIYIFRKA